MRRAHASSSAWHGPKLHPRSKPAVPDDNAPPRRGAHIHVSVPTPLANKILHRRKRSIIRASLQPRQKIPSALRTAACPPKEAFRVNEFASGRLDDFRSHWVLA